MVELRPFTAHSLDIKIKADFRISGNGFEVRFKVDDPDRVIVDSLTPRNFTGAEVARADGLWTTTCFEAFFGRPHESGYWELNLSGQKPEWNLYRFDDYRMPMPPRWEHSFQLERLSVSGDELYCRLAGPMPASDLRANLCAVIKTTGGIHYYSVEHKGAEPDFHLL